MECLQSINLRSILAIDCMVSKGTAAHDHEKHDLVAAITKNIYTNITMLLSQIIYIYILYIRIQTVHQFLILTSPASKKLGHALCL